MPKRNWAAICRIDDYHTRVAVSLATDPNILACYARGFPHLFTEGEDEGPLRVPLSVLMQAAEEYSRCEDPESDIWMADRHFMLGWAGERYPHLDIPVAHQWGDVHPPVPDFVLQQLVGQKAQAGLIVEIDGIKFVVGSIDFSGETPEIGSVFEVAPAVDNMYLFDAAFIALDK